MPEVEKSPEIGRLVIGQGYLGWNSDEAGTGRYGTVNLWKSLKYYNPENSIELNVPFEGSYGVLFAEVLETHSSNFHGTLIKEELPKVGDFVVLGEGFLFKDGTAGIENVGVKPDIEAGEEKVDWLNSRALTRLHNQKVKLYFEDPMKTNGIR